MNRSVSTLIVFMLLSLLVSFICDALVVVASNTRRRLLTTTIPSITAFVNAGTVLVGTSYALDIDAFVNKELATDTAKATSRKELSNDEALCKYGQPSKDRGDACVRAGLPISIPGRTVNAYGEVDRGTYVRCKQFYELEEEGYVKKTFCE